MLLALYRVKSGSPETAHSSREQNTSEQEMSIQVLRRGHWELLGRRDEALHNSR